MDGSILSEQFNAFEESKNRLRASSDGYDDDQTSPDKMANMVGKVEELHHFIGITEEDTILENQQDNNEKTPSQSNNYFNINAQEEHMDTKLESLHHSSNNKEDILMNKTRLDCNIKTFACYHCNYKCSLKGYIKQHLLTHTREKPFACNLCDYKSSRKGLLKRHLQTHTGEKPFVCNICNYKSSRKAHLQRHLLTHTGVKPFACNICDNKFTQKGYLKRHLLAHTRKKPFKCDICYYKSLLIDTGKKSCESNTCTLECSRKTTHTREKPFKCNICDCKYTQKSHLNRHLLSHTGKKPFECTICDYKSFQKASLKRHLPTHTGEKPFECNICDYKCSNKGELKRHLTIHPVKKNFKCTSCR